MFVIGKANVITECTYWPSFTVIMFLHKLLAFFLLLQVEGPGRSEKREAECVTYIAAVFPWHLWWGGMDQVSRKDERAFGYRISDSWLSQWGWWFLCLWSCCTVFLRIIKKNPHIMTFLSRYCLVSACSVEHPTNEAFLFVSAPCSLSFSRWRQILKNSSGFHECMLHYISGKTRVPFLPPIMFLVSFCFILGRRSCWVAMMTTARTSTGCRTFARNTLALSQRSRDTSHASE